MADITKGPWKAVRGHFASELIVCEIAGGWIVVAPDGDFFADTDEGDARLIAASPRLLAALEAVLPYIDDADDVASVFPQSAWSIKCRSAVIEAKAAFQEARGEGA